MALQVSLTHDCIQSGLLCLQLACTMLAADTQRLEVNTSLDNRGLKMTALLSLCAALVMTACDLALQVVMIKRSIFSSGFLATCAFM